MALAEGAGKKLEDVHRPKGMNEEHYKALKKQAKSIDWTGYDKNKQKVFRSCLKMDKKELYG